MKKISFTIPKPCHENWDAMTPDDKGRFCGSCQKSVVDFSEMSDRQVAEFFKKPTGSVCGRFHNDQLNRDFVIPKKRIPWLRYFFTISLPAFLASCKWGGRQVLQGAAVVEKIQVTHTIGDTIMVPPPPVMGEPIPAIAAGDSVPKKKPLLQKVRIAEGYTVGKLTPPFVGMEEETPVVEPLIERAKETAPMDTVSITGYGTKKCNVVMGGLSVIRTVAKKQEAVKPIQDPEESFSAVAYPNPVRTGETITVLLKSGSGTPVRFQLFSSSGASMLRQKASVANGCFSFAVPSALTAGTYFFNWQQKKAHRKP